MKSSHSSPSLREGMRRTFGIAALLLLLAHPGPALAQEALPQSATQGQVVAPAPPSPSGTAGDEQSQPGATFLDDPIRAVTQILQNQQVAGASHDLSPWGMFLAADWVVKAVMLGLVFASLVTWTIGLAKAVEIACAGARAKRALAKIARSQSLGEAARDLAAQGGPAAVMARAAEDELRQSLPALDHAGVAGMKERLASRLSRIEAQAGRRLTRGTGILATIGATAPFVGLFGTVWGIMNAFIGISRTQTTNLAVVAPGIAEALLATAIGLVAAIPAVMIYNLFARAVAGYRQRLADASAAVDRLVSLELDLRRVPVSGGPAMPLAAE